MLPLSAYPATPSDAGQSGLINMPDGRIAPDGHWRIGLSHGDPYTTIWSSMTVLPRLEFSARYTRIRGVPGFVDDSRFGDTKDKAFDAKLQLFRETRHSPALAVGVQDFLGTRLFNARYVSVSKALGHFDLSVGVGEDRIDGVFGGIRYYPWRKRRFSVVAEYDAYDYENDPFGQQSGAHKRRRGAKLGFEYRYGWLGARLAADEDGEVSANTYVSIPLMEREFIPKIHEPAPYTKSTTQHTVDEWRENPGLAAPLVKALEAQQFKNIKLLLRGRALEARLTNTRITLVGRAVGRAARTLLLLGPQDVESLKIIYTDQDVPLLSYYFHDAYKLHQYFAGRLTRHQIDRTIDVIPARPEDSQRFFADAKYRVELEGNAPIPRMSAGQEGHILSVEHADSELNSYALLPVNFGVFFNDPSGAFHYDVFALGRLRQHWTRGLFFDAEVRVRLAEDVSDVTQVSNSLLPHVRSDIAAYRRERDPKISKLLLNQYFHPAQNHYARVSLGLYEEMFGGLGAQWLYLPRASNWAVDMDVNWLRQRDTAGRFGFRKYETTTGLLSLHYRLPKLGLTASTRVGRFLAKDNGVRFEIKRRFRSGVEFGAWYTVTDIDDITPPGSPDDPYRDKGLFITIPLRSMLTADTRARPKLSISPWTRDVGQMVRSPDDLYYRIEERASLSTTDYSWLSGLSD